MSTYTTSKPINYKEVYFNHTSLKKVTENPNRADIRSIYNQNKANAASVPSILGGGHHGHLCLVPDTITYNQIIPNNPYLLPTYPILLGVNNGKEAQIAEVIHQNSITINAVN